MWSGGDVREAIAQRDKELPEALRRASAVLLPQVREMLKKGCDSQKKELDVVGRQRLRALQRQLEAGGSELTMASVRGHGALKKELEEAVVWPYLRPDIFSQIRRPPQGILLYGPPGNGKTMIAEALANRLGVPFYQVRVSEVISKYSGESEKNIQS